MNKHQYTCYDNYSNITRVINLLNHKEKPHRILSLCEPRSPKSPPDGVQINIQSPRSYRGMVINMQWLEEHQYLELIKHSRDVLGWIENPPEKLVKFHNLVWEL